ncbi:MAG: class I SAM-dependent methyltransferase [Ketobacteraceae bacterium]|nr:class I SAM-dependent methyltransferase [Ketobacteraceae bacterium]
MDSSSISFTALYTGQVWYENGLSAPFFTSGKGRLMYLGLRPAEKLSEWALGTNMYHMLLQRHHIMDYRIHHLIQEGATQVLEIACGMSPRGHDFTRRYPELHYVEADLPDMARKKRQLLEEQQALGPNHQVISCNILEQGKPHGLDYILNEVLDTTRPTIVITEGLINYFSKEAISPFWKTLATEGKKFPQLWYLADCYPLSRNNRLFRVLTPVMKTLSAITRAEVNPLFESDDALKEEFISLGFSGIKVHKPEEYYDVLDIPVSRGKAFTRVLEAKA